MANNTISRALMIGGLLVSAASAADMMGNTVLGEEGAARAKLTQDIGKRLGVEKQCASSGAGFVEVYYCSNRVSGVHTEEETSAILAQYDEELAAGNRQIPHDSGAQARAERDLLGFVGGLGMTGVGGLRSTSKERG
ncbi:hypothetical protein HY948_01275 [Candidatus Gottesmanbacteria bacterium]|nr:hypothetical protein [Candidatus Gottesmanbacteria bacterium]